MELLKLSDGTLAGIKAHYAHAQEKHPHFADKVCEMPADFFEFMAKFKKEEAERAGEIKAYDVLMAEIDELFAELMRGDMTRAREEAFDAIAVVLRIIDVIDGRAKFGAPKKEDGHE